MVTYYYQTHFVHFIVGADCSIDIDECQSKPCAGNANCTDFTPEQKINKGVGYDCMCLAGFEKVDGKCIGMAFSLLYKKAINPKRTCH